MPDHPCHMQGRGFLATGHNLVPTSCQELPPQRTAWGPAITLLCPHGSYGCPLPNPCPGEGVMTRTRRVTHSLWSCHPGYFPQTLAYLLETGLLCSVDCPGLTQFTQTQSLSCSKGPPRAL